MSIITENLLSDIDDLDDITLESMLDVYSSLSSQYEKIMTMNDGSMDIVMEGDVIDYATGKNTIDSGLKKILLFLPRLLIGIAKSITGTFSKDYKAEKDEAYKRAEENLNIADEEDLNAAAEEVKKITEGNMEFDPKTKKLSIVGKFKDYRRKIKTAKKAKKIFIRIRNEAVNANTDYKALAAEVSSIIKGDKKMDAVTTSITLEALNTALDDAKLASDGIGDIAKETSAVLDKKIKEELAKGDKADKSKLDSMKLLSDQISSVAGDIHGMAKFGKFGKGVIDFFGQDASRAVGKYTPFLRHTKGFKKMAMKGATGSENFVRAQVNLGKKAGGGIFRKAKNFIHDAADFGNPKYADAESKEKMTEARVRGKAKKVKDLEKQLKKNNVPGFDKNLMKKNMEDIAIQKLDEKNNFGLDIEKELDEKIAKLEAELEAKKNKT